MLDALWCGPLAWGLARALVTAWPLERMRFAIHRRSASLGYLVTCVPCASAWLAVPGATLVGLAASSPFAGIACWSGAWGIALLLDASLERLQARHA